jgi:hypothetical protein
LFLRKLGRATQHATCRVQQRALHHGSRNRTEPGDDQRGRADRPRADE